MNYTLRLNGDPLDRNSNNNIKPGEMKSAVAISDEKEIRSRNRKILLKGKIRKLKSDIMKAIIPIAIVIAAALAIIIASTVMRVLKEHEVKDFGRERAYMEYTIGYGDTLWDIAEDMSTAMPEYESPRTYLKDLRAENMLYRDDIKQGDIIRLPYYKNTDEQDAILDEYKLR